MMYDKPKRVKIPRGYLGFKSGVALGTNGVHYFVRLDDYNGYDDNPIEWDDECPDWELDFHYILIEEVIQEPDEIFTDEEYKEFFV